MTVVVDPRGIIGAFGRFGELQLPFATALTLTRLAQGYREEAKKNLPGKFTIRTGWIAKGFRVKTATKRDLSSAVSQLDPFMALQETGGEKRPTARSTVAVPVQMDRQGHPGARPDPEDVTRPSKWPGALLQGKRGFIVRLRTGDELVLRRIRRGRKKVRARDAAGHFIASSGARRRKGGPKQLRKMGQQDPRVSVMYLLKRRVKIRARWGFREAAAQYASREFPTLFRAAWAEALRTAR